MSKHGGGRDDRDDDHKRNDRGGSDRGGKPGKASTGAPSQRMLRVAELIRHKLAEMLSRGEVHDDTIGNAVITVPEVRLSPDLKLATVYVMPLGGKDITVVLAALDRNKAFLRREIARAVNLKYAPELRFRKDETFEEADRIERLLASPKVRQDTDRS